MNIPFRKALLPALVASSLSLAGCGSSSDIGNTAESGTLTSGIITGFGSVYVNGIKFETDDARFSVDDDDNASQDALKVGMVVTINGVINPDGKSGKARKIHYDNDIEGPVASIEVIEETPSESDPEILLPTVIEVVILGQVVVIDLETVLYSSDDEPLAIGDIQVGDILEVSGLMDAEGRLQATHVELQAGADAGGYEFEIRGPVASLDLNAGSFILRGFRVVFDEETEFDDMLRDDLVNGRWVEVKGRLSDDGMYLMAREIEAEDPGMNVDFDDEADYRVELEGLITDFDPEEMTFQLQGMPVDYSQAEEIKPEGAELGDDLRIKLEGRIVDGVIIAKEIKLLSRHSKIKIVAPVVAVDNSHETDASAILLTLGVFGEEITVRVNQQTELDDDLSMDNGSMDEGSMDEGSLDDMPLTLDDSLIGRFVKVEAFADDSGIINAIELETTDDMTVRLKAPVTGFAIDGQQVTVEVLGHVFDVSGAEKIVGHGGSIDMPPASWNMLHSQPIVEFFDDDADGDIDRFRKHGDDDDDEHEDDGKNSDDQPTDASDG